MRTETARLSDLLFGQTRGHILALLYGMPDRNFYVREIARQTGVSVGSVQRELETLSQVQLLNRELRGKQVFYQANRDHPVFADLSSLVAKTAGIFPLLRAALAPLAQKISAAFVYGSMARGDENAGSDVDLMIVGDVTLDDVLAHVTAVEGQLGRPINPTVYSRKEFRTKLKERNHFLNSVMRGKTIFLIGDEDEFRKMG
jgi:predicted nucleotidyltransferase